MSMERLRGVRVTCDNCGVDYGWTEFDTLREAAEQVRRDGWLVEKNRLVTCPSCWRKHG